MSQLRNPCAAGKIPMFFIAHSGVIFNFLHIKPDIVKKLVVMMSLHHVSPMGIQGRIDPLHPSAYIVRGDKMGQSVCCGLQPVMEMVILAFFDFFNHGFIPTYSWSCDEKNMY